MHRKDSTWSADVSADVRRRQMTELFENQRAPPAEREVRSLSDKSGVPVAEVRTLFSHEFARLKMGAKVGSYLGVLTTSNVRGMLRRKARLAAEAESAGSCAADGVDVERKWKEGRT